MVWCPNNYEDKMEDERKSYQSMIKLISDSNYTFFSITFSNPLMSSLSEAILHFCLIYNSLILITSYL
jgi:hypothetical protein